MGALLSELDPKTLRFQEMAVFWDNNNNLVEIDRRFIHHPADVGV
jgi:hypothetical protein